MAAAKEKANKPAKEKKKVKPKGMPGAEAKVNAADVTHCCHTFYCPPLPLMSHLLLPSSPITLILTCSPAAKS